MTKLEDDQTGIEQTWKTTKLEDDQNGKRTKYKLAKALAWVT